MKANIKNITKKIVSWASALAIAMTAAMSSGLTAWADEAYPSVGNGFTAYTISTSRTYTYSSAYLNGDAIGWVDGSDEFKITSLMRNRNTGRVAAKITYSTSRGSKTAWIDYSAITVANPLPTEKNTSRAGLTTYKRPNGARCGSVDYGDTVFKLGNRDGYTNIMYNLGSASNPSGWKYAWVPSSDYDNYIGTKTQSYDYSTSAVEYPLRNARCSWSGFSNSTWSWSENRNGSGGGRVYHLGLDLTSSNKNVYSCASGKVVACSSSPNGANGRYVIVQHTIGGRNCYSFYAHLASVNAWVGQSVDTGTKLGVIGGSGYGSNSYYGTHLHFAITDTLWSGGGYWGYSTYFSGNTRVYDGVTYYNPKYVVENDRLP